MKKQKRKNPLALSKKEMQRIGYKVIDTIVEHIAQVEHIKVHAQKTPQYLNKQLGGPIPEEGQDALALIEQAKEEIFANILAVPFVPLGAGNSSLQKVVSEVIDI